MKAAWLEAVAAALLPPRCGLCDQGQTTRPTAGLCQACRDALPLLPPLRCRRCDLPGVAVCPPCEGERAFDRLGAAYLYGGGIADLVTAVKFEGREDLGEGLGELLAAAPVVRELGAGCSAVVPVPLSRPRLRTRGYNQAGLLGIKVAKTLGLPLVHALTRARHTQPQSDLGLMERQQNVAGAFVGKLVTGTILLIDDVATSTSTAEAAAQALRTAGAARVRVLVLARTA